MRHYFIYNVKKTHQFGIMTWEDFQKVDQISPRLALEQCKFVYVLAIAKLRKFLYIS